MLVTLIKNVLVATSGSYCSIKTLRIVLYEGEYTVNSCLPTFAALSNNDGALFLEKKQCLLGQASLREKKRVVCILLGEQYASNFIQREK